MIFDDDNDVLMLGGLGLDLDLVCTLFMVDWRFKNENVCVQNM